MAVNSTDIDSTPGYMNVLKSTPGGMPRLASEDRPVPRTNRKSTGWTSDVTARSRSLLNLMISRRQTMLTQAAGDLQPTLHAAGVRADHRPAAVPQVHHVEDKLHPGVQLGAGHAVKVGVEPQVLLAGEVGVQRRVLEDQPDVAPDRVPLPEYVVPGHPRGPRGGVREGAQDLDGGRLARSVRAEEAKGLTRPNLEVDAADRLKLSVALHQVGDPDGGLGH
jgi:hypothetical protein